MKVFIINGYRAENALFEHLGFKIVNNATEADLLCFTGGADIGAEIYNEPNHPSMYTNPRRDAEELGYARWGLAQEVPMVGICRGGQLLNALNGGKMYQDISGHGNYHMMKDIFHDEEYEVSSVHHQMMMPAEKGKVIGYSVGVRTPREWYENAELKRDVTYDGIEVVHYEDTKCLCFQGHPEYEIESTMTNRFGHMIRRLLLA